MRLKQHWAGPLASALAGHDGLILDMRSEAYAALGPRPARADSVFVRVVSEEGGRKRALNHFNKRAKGALVRALAEDRPRVASVDDVLAWADGAGWRMRAGAHGEIDVIV